MVERDEERVQEYFSRIRDESENTSDSVMESAVLRGIEQGKRRKIRRRRSSILVTAAAAILLVFAAVSTAETLEQRARLAAQQPKPWNELEVFRPLIKDNLTLKSALDAGYVQRFENAVAEKDGYKLTVNGAVADKYGMLLLYTFENTTGQKVAFGGMQIQDSDGSSLNYGLYTSSYTGDSQYTPVEHRMIEVRWEHPGELQNRLMAELSFTKNPVSNPAIGGPDELSKAPEDLLTLKVPIILDPVMLNNPGEEITLNQTIEIADQSIIVKKAIVAHTGTYITIQNAPDNSMEIFSLIDARVVEGGESRTYGFGSSLGFGVPDTGQTLVFDHDNMNKDDALALTLKGIHALDKSKLDVIVDTDKMKILQAPDGKLSVSKGEQYDRPGEIAFNYTMNDPDNAFGINVGSVSLDNTFTDGDGDRHEFKTSGSSQSTGGPEGYVSSSFYDKGSADLPQPLTFKLFSYPSPIMEEHTLKIR
ncbi:DUF4179 domain-containing protein [Paenibacillus sp. sgz500958]|uniref:DUF4179 domain-containing protein n=1 Tax=Paenibacillus sp. sgz500958 TaxID=3242475 RepID=UPI0036D35C1B